MMKIFRYWPNRSRPGKRRKTKGSPAGGFKKGTADRRNNIEQQRWRETVQTLKSASEGKLVAADKVHAWLDTWGKENETSPPMP
jgi:hypothetical protein